MNDHEIIKVKLAEVADAATSMILAMEGLDDRGCKERITRLSEQYTVAGLDHSAALEKATFEVLVKREKRLNVGAILSEAPPLDLNDPEIMERVQERAAEYQKAGMPEHEALEKAGLEILNPFEERSRGWRK